MSVVTHAKLGKVSEAVKEFARDYFCFHSAGLARIHEVSKGCNGVSLLLTQVNTSLAVLGYSADMAELPLINPDVASCLSLAGEAQFADNGIVSRTLLRTPNCRVVLFGFAEGQELTEHTSTQQALVQVLSGECEFSLAGEKRLLKTGDLLSMPPHLPHSVRASSRFSMLLTLVKP